MEVLRGAGSLGVSTEVTEGDGLKVDRVPGEYRGYGVDPGIFVILVKFEVPYAA